MRDGVHYDALPWSTGGTERLALGVGWCGRCARGGESIIGGVEEPLDDGDRAISPRDVPSGGSREVPLEKRQAVREGYRGIGRFIGGEDDGE